MEATALKMYEENSQQVIAQAEALMIVDQATRESAAEFTSNTRKAIKAIEAEFRPDIDAANRLHKDLLARLKVLSAPFKQARLIVDREIGRDFLEQEKVRMAAERKAQEKELEEERAQKAELAAEAEQCIIDGDMDRAEELLDADVVVNSVIPVADVQRTVRTGGGSTTVRKDIKVELVSKMDVIKAVFHDKLPSVLLTVDVGAAKRYAKANGIVSSKFNTMPGFKVTETTVVSGRVG